MNLPQLTAKIGQAAKQEIGDSSELAMLVKPLNVDGDHAYILFMTIDVDNQEIRFEEPIPYSESAPYQYHYFGNNSAAGMQYYVTREANSAHYLLKSVFSDLYLVLKKHDLLENELGALLAEMNQKKVIHLGNKKGTGTVNLGMIKGLLSAWIDEKNNIVVDGTTRKAEDFLRYVLQWENKDDTFALVVPRVIYNQKTIILAQHPDYVAVTKKEQNLEGTSNNKAEKFCYICHNKSADVSSELTTKLSRSGINKIFATTTFNYAKNIDKKHYDDSYAICSTCFQDLLFGEKKVTGSFSARIAGERAFILPEGLLDDFNYNQLTALKQGADLFFKKGLAQELDDQLETAMDDFTNAEAYVIHFFIYRTDGNSVTVLKTIEDVPTMHIVRILYTLGKQVEKLSPHIRSMSLNTIYRMIPVRTNKSGDQLDIQRVLSIYQSLFSKTTIETNVLFGYAAEAIEKGFREIRKKQGSQFTNLGWQSFVPDQEDFYFKRLTMSYLCLLQTCQELSILDRDVFQNRGVMKVDLSGMSKNVQEIEAFLEAQSFDSMPRALFYVGVLLRSVAQAQYQKKHKTKPILNKLSFQGMNQREVVWLYQAVIEKLHQYDKMTMENEQYIKMFNHYFGTIDESKALTDQAHLFYIMAGYAFHPPKSSDHEGDANTQSMDEGNMAVTSE
ncbi:TM1802 family CRISPR-associated protein [Brevibacillus humidisoli]|uniref:TM1802 family CRISPR-associated protein n=1 Tax=Brevibacillus humidisoli TaxID=2895522 RepID=UPI001E315D5B|nr:TM1802 family CRISPR-associated protein [Brevibacillus humidisoli]UFJ39860.1 TM1802 family CRISPR-associated protein [Brevibacillus humidisoli]